MYKISILVKGLIAIGRIFFGGYLTKSGWIKSTLSGKPVDSMGDPLPWFNYGAIEFIKSRLQSSFIVFEYGSGNSTLWFAKRVGHLFSVEHDAAWFELMTARIQHFSTIDYVHRNLQNDVYANEISKHEKIYDVIIIDGRDRVKCCLNSLSALKDDGIIIWDNSERQKYKVGFDFLVKNGFRRLDFWGLGPINSYPWCTSIFYRQNNCFQI